MEQHPVPQNVTTFQFRLVGDMTIKQFCYLAGGIIGGYICYKLPLPFFFTWPLAITSGLLGFGLAFVPVEERPMDVWIVSFFKNVYSPTQWVWQKEKRAPATTPGVKAISHTPGVDSRAILTMHQRNNPLEWLTSLFQNKPKSVTPSLAPGFSLADALAEKKSTPPPTPAPQPPTSEVKTPPTSEVTPAPHPATHDRVIELQTQLSEALSQRERLEKELIAIRQKLEQQAKMPQPAPVRTAGVVTPTAPATSVRVIAPEAAAKAGLPRLTTFPNVVTGIVKDHWENLLSGMLVTVRDKDDVPLRALKTNKLGQFAASTPLPNGTYMVEIEDPKEGFVFDKVQINLTGAVAPAIEVIAKSQKQVERDKLAREIFGPTI